MNKIQVKEKRVEQIELFYDLIYVYAISRLTLLVEDGGVTFSKFGSYFVSCFVILQAWLYLTNYVNRYGRWQWYEYLLTAINMIGAVYMANTISPKWAEMSLTFNLAMLVMLSCVWLMYFIQLLLKEQDTGAAKNSLLILAVDCLLYFAAFLASASHAAGAVVWIDIAAVLLGAFLPFFIRGNFDIKVISFPHLAERFELLTIVTFGESVVGMTGYFDVKHFSLRPVLVFTIILLLFACYMLQLHEMCNHERQARALLLMFSHYLIVISVNLVTVGFHFLENPEVNRTFTAVLMAVALLLFYISIYANSAYYYDRYSFTCRDAVLSALALLLGNGMIFLAGKNIYLFLCGALLAVVGNFCLLYNKYKDGQQIQN